MSIEKDFVPYQESVELKKLGFDEPCLGYFNTTSYLGIGSFVFKECDKNTIDGYGNKPLLRPTFSQTFRWFREEHGLECCLKKNSDILNSRIMYLNGKEVCRFIIKDKKWELMDRDDEAYKKNSAYYEKTYTYEEAELACLKKLIEIVKQSHD